MEEGLIMSVFLSVLVCMVVTGESSTWADLNAISEQPLSKIAIYKTVLGLHSSASVRASPNLLGLEVSSYFLLYNLFAYVDHLCIIYIFLLNWSQM